MMTPEQKQRVAEIERRVWPNFRESNGRTVISGSDFECLLHMLKDTPAWTKIDLKDRATWPEDGSQNWVVMRSDGSVVYEYYWHGADARRYSYWKPAPPPDPPASP